MDQQQQSTNGGGDTQQQQQAAEWFGAEQKEYVTNKGWQKPADAITSVQNLEKLLGADRAGRTVILPKDEKDLEGQKAFRAKIGVPEKAEEYQLATPEGEATEFAKAASTWMLEAGIPKSAAQALVGKWNTYFAEALKAEQAQAEQTSTRELDALKGEWGQAFEVNAEHAKRFARAFGFDESRLEIYEAAFGTAQMLKDFHAFGVKLGEQPFAGGDTTTQSGKMSPGAARQKIEELKAQRIEGKIGEQFYLAEMSRLGPMADQGS